MKSFDEIESKPGIYRLINLTNNKSYVGQSINVHTRITTHFRNLHKNKHVNIHMQNAWNINNGNFDFEILKYCDTADLDQLEDYYIKLFKSNDSELGYNIRIDNKSNRGLKWTDSQRIKMNLAIENNPWFHNHTIPKETIEKAHKATKGSKWTEDMCKKHSVRMKGLKVKDTSKMSLAQTGSNNPSAKLNETMVREILYLILQLHIDKSSVAQKYNISISTIYGILQNRIWRNVDRNLNTPSQEIIENAIQKLDEYGDYINYEFEDDLGIRKI